MNHLKQYEAIRNLLCKDNRTENDISKAANLAMDAIDKIHGGVCRASELAVKNQGKV